VLLGGEWVWRRGNLSLLAYSALLSPLGAVGSGYLVSVKPSETQKAPRAYRYRFRSPSSSGATPSSADSEGPTDSNQDRLR
jgi:hypothetical protein